MYWTVAGFTILFKWSRALLYAHACSVNLPALLAFLFHTGFTSTLSFTGLTVCLYKSAHYIFAHPIYPSGHCRFKRAALNPFHKHIFFFFFFSATANNKLAKGGFILSTHTSLIQNGSHDKLTGAVPSVAQHFALTQEISSNSEIPVTRCVAKQWGQRAGDCDHIRFVWNTVM